MTINNKKKGFGYIPDIPAVEDFNVNNIETNLLPKNLLGAGSSPIELPRKVDNRKWCSPVDDQGELGCCGPDAAISMFEYMEKKAFGKFVDASRLFTYWNTRNIMGSKYLKVDSGVYNRSVMKAIINIGLIRKACGPMTSRHLPRHQQPRCSPTRNRITHFHI